MFSNFHEKCCTNNSLLSRDKTISSLLELIGYVLLISEYVFKKTLTAFEILMKNLHTKRCTSNYVIHVSKDFLPLHFAVGQVLSVSGYDLEHGRMTCKQKYIALKAWQ